MKTRERILAAALSIGFALAMTAPVSAEGGGETPPPPAKCNSGRGNQSETTPATDCDPGNSGGHNNGGD